MQLNDIINVQVSVRNRTPSLANFGVPLILAFTSVGTEGGLVRSYKNLDEVRTDGHEVDSAVYHAAKALFSQSPRPKVVKVGRRPTANDQTIDFLPQVTTAGKKYSLTVVQLGVEYTAEYVVQSGDNASAISTGLKAALDALSVANLTTSISSNALRCVYTPNGGQLEYRRVSPYLKVTDVTTVGTLLDDYAAVVLEDPGFYCVTVADNQSADAILALAEVVETQQRILVGDVVDTDCLDPNEDADALSSLKAQAYTRTYAPYDRTIGQHSAFALAAGRLAAVAGSDTWAYKAPVGILTSELNATEQGALEAKNGNFFSLVGGVRNTFWGKTPSGEYMDVTRGLDALIATIQSNVYSLLSNSPKVPFTKEGIAQIKGEVRSGLKTHSKEPYNFITEEYTVTAPDIADVTEQNREDRFLEGVSFSAILQDAIHKVGVTGNLSR